MTIKSDKWIRRMADQTGMIEPFEPGQVREGEQGRIISYGTSSYGYDVRCSNEFKIFTNVHSATVDPKNFDENSFITFELLTTTDVRTLPRECPGTETLHVGDARARAGHSTKWEEAIFLANPPPSLNGAANVGGMDALIVGANADRLTPGVCTAPIPTGAIVTNSPPGDYDPDFEDKSGWFPDMICSAPGCA